MRITKAANEQLGFPHPTNADWNHISFCQFAGPVDARRRRADVGTNAVAIRPGKIDRSPTGTGCSARMAVLHARGEMQVGDRFIGQLDHRLRVSLPDRRASDVGGRPAIVPVISGRAWIIGTQQLMLDPDDPLPAGYRLSDTWPTDL